MSSPVLIRPGDAVERRRAIDPSGSFLVQAPAGSGKTELLIQRYLNLLSVVEKPERIQAITFTRKAAGEMRERIIHALERARAGETPEEPHERDTYELACAALARDRELGWGLLENPSRMKLQTIDSLCGGIVAQMPWLARQGRLLEVIEEATPHYLRAAQRTVMMVEQEGRHREHLERILMHLDNHAGNVARLIAAMLATRDQWLSLAVSIGDESREQFDRALEAIVADGREAVRKLLPRHLRAPLYDLFADDWQAMADAFLTQKGEWKKRPGAAYAALLAELREVPGLPEALHFIRLLPHIEYSDAQWQTTRSMFECLKLAVAQLRLVFQDEGQVDFSEITQAAQYALGHAEDPTELALKLDARIEHLLIDEFQDTSLTQFALAEKLIEGWEPFDGRTIFLVGDPMQSIYRFREAEVGLFLGTREKGIGNVNPHSLVLHANYRSTREIVEWVNRAFASIFPPLDDPETGAISYSPSHATKPDSGTAIHFHPFTERQDLREAETVVSLIHQARREDPEGTVAILVRARTHLPAIVDQLKKAGLSFRAVEIDELSERAVVRDLLALTRALLHVGDRLSWLAILRAPWCGLTLADLHALAAADPKAFIYDLLRGDLSALSSDGLRRASHFLAVIEAAFASRGRTPLRTWVERTWRELGGPSCAEDSAASQDATDYLDLLEREQSGSDLPDFDAFARRVGNLKAKADPTANEWLQIMTIHKAKGLQFDTVILPGLGRQARRDDSRMFLFHRGLIAPIKESAAEFDPIYVYLAELEKRRGKHEIVRLLYVAATRARKSLHLMGSAKVYANEVKPIPGSLLAALWQG